MTEAERFLLPQFLLLLIIMQFLSAFVGWRLKQPLLTIISNSVLSGAVFGVVVYQVSPVGGFEIVAIALSVVVACCYGYVLKKSLG